MHDTPNVWPVHDPDDVQRDRHLDPHADDGRERRPGIEPEQADCSGDGELGEVRSAEKRGRTGDAVLFPGD
ncbi:hypothetical protein IED13_16525 [Bosea sp. SSUT16]|uniref:Uncharacterized protein n=1 Tax=Bosea spartocytisi TaxID=2773451 RepID=A0A927EAJ8_9HYPH|nr:hypothetical protein [Bosea spartocytisi]